MWGGRGGGRIVVGLGDGGKGEFGWIILESGFSKSSFTQQTRFGLEGGLSCGYLI